MHRRFLWNTLVLLSLAGVSVGCSRAQVVCDLICECQHCSDQDEIMICARYSTLEDEADAYGCSDAWTAYTICIEEKGTCDETTLEFSIRDNGGNRCSKEGRGLLDCIDAASAHGGFDF
ncbi:hypothetical protein [Polyangium sp. y55x31]|uniref:hypothetical protein n=1 Tax=Polyangium sp. y55x31 TaxID=3042688 RepID=UPI002482EEB0|nr:hypothetical protein [Polyangium sp. y55x31]MDI1483299.1 hypothetical protein [Polyangium sp. y55x31]